MKKRSSSRLAVILIGRAFLTAAAAFAPGQQLDQQDLASIQKYRAAAPDVESGQALLLKGKLDQAEKKLLKALNTLPEHAIAAYLLADCYYKQGRVDEGLENIVQAEANFANFNRVLYRWQMGNINQFMADKTRLNDQMSDLQFQLSKAKVESEKRRIENEIAKTQASQNASPQRTKEQLISESYTIPADYLYLHGNLLFKKKEYQAAMDQYLQAVTADPKHGNSYNNIANLYYMGRQYDKAREYLEKAEANGAQINPAFKEAIAKALNK